MAGCQVKKNDKAFQKGKYTVGKDTASIRTRHGRDGGMIRPGTGNNYDYMLRAQVDKTESTREQTGNVSREVEILTEPRRIKTL